MSASTVPAVLTALVAGMQAANADLQVIDGEPLSNQPNDFAAIGWSDEEPAVTIDEQISDAGLRSQLEVYSVTSVVVAWDGDTDMGAKRTRAYGYLDAFHAWLATNRRLGGACMIALLTESALTQSQTGKGALAKLRFTVHVQAKR